MQLHEQERGPKLTTGTTVRREDGFRSNDIMRDPIPHRLDTTSVVSGLWGHSTSEVQSLQSLSPQPFVPEGILTTNRGISIGGRTTGSGSGGGQGRGVLQNSQKRVGGGIQTGDHTGFLRVRGLPFSATKDDIYKFFIGCNPIQESIVLTYRNDGRATGEAYIGFAVPEDSKRAMEFNRKSMGSRYIELFISNKEEHGRAFTRFGNR